MSRGNKYKIWFGALRVLVIGAVLYIGLGVFLGTWAFWDTYGDYESTPQKMQTVAPKNTTQKSRSSQERIRQIKLSDVSRTSRTQILNSVDTCIDKQALLEPSFVKPSQLIFRGKAEQHSLISISGQGSVATCMVSEGVTQIILRESTPFSGGKNEQWLLVLP